MTDQKKVCNPPSPPVSQLQAGRRETRCPRHSGQEAEPKHCHLALDTGLSGYTPQADGFLQVKAKILRSVPCNVKMILLTEKKQFLTHSPTSHLVTGVLASRNHKPPWPCRPKDDSKASATKRRRTFHQEGRHNKEHDRLTAPCGL